jgi:hypothetical protein
MCSYYTVHVLSLLGVNHNYTTRDCVHLEWDVGLQRQTYNSCGLEKGLLDAVVPAYSFRFFLLAHKQEMISIYHHHHHRRFGSTKLFNKHPFAQVPTSRHYLEPVLYTRNVGILEIFPAGCECSFGIPELKIRNRQAIRSAC